MLKQAVRLACAKRIGCVSEEDYRRAQDLLDVRLRQLRAATNESVPAGEVEGAFAFGVERASTQTDEEAWAALGDHTHLDDDGPIPLTQPVVVPPFPVDALPKVYANMASAVAEATRPIQRWPPHRH